MITKIRIGTRESTLAVWQANYAKKKLQDLGINCEIIKIRSKGDINQITPLYDFGVSGIFTKNLDQALLNNRIDIAVHSLKDVPINMASGITIQCVFGLSHGFDNASLVMVLEYANVLKRCTTHGQACCF